MKNKIINIIKDYIKEYQKQDNISTRWGEPLVGFADANHPYIKDLKNTLGSYHLTPNDILDGAKIIIACYLPFSKEFAEQYREIDEVSLREWTVAYKETNAMFKKLNLHLISILKEEGYRAEIPAMASEFSTETFRSKWSLVHHSYAAGLGTPGINNMLITRSGCCGRLNNLVTDLHVEPDAPIEEELCLYKKNGSCKVCVDICPVGSLRTDGCDALPCWDYIMKNADLYTGEGKTYTDITGKTSNICFTDFCGKCVTQAPCAFWE